MKNILRCENCGKENHFYQLTCSECKSFLRARIVNIDFWDTLWKIFYSPVDTAKNIIQAENKNFVATCAFITAIKFSLLSLILMNAFHIEENGRYTFFRGVIFGGIPFICLISVFALVVTYINKKFGIQGRIKDALSIYFFSFTPLFMTFLILTPIQFALFGEYWFTFNPSPLIVKPQAAIVIFFIEILMYLWSGVLFVTSTYAQTKNIIYSVILGLIGFTVLTVIIFYLAVFIH
ncbi:hypothetical protein C0389_03500 [bacterium]|nr:hypothetical protein [bacterium]